MNDINFVRQRRKTLGKTQKQDRKIMFYALAGFGLTITVFFVILFIEFSISSNLHSIEAQQDQIKELILGDKSTEEKYFTTLSKLNVLNDIFQDRQDKQVAINYFSTAFGEDVIIYSIEYDDEQKLLTFTVKSKDVFVLENVFEQLKIVGNSPQFQSVSSSNLVRDDNGSYSINVVVVLGQKE